jgi:hypothetical protein
MAGRRPYRSGTLGGTEHACGLPALIGAPARPLPPAANDNKAPLLLKLRRLVFGTVAALTVTWLFWVGLLR